MFFHLSLKKNKWRKRLLHHLLNKKTNKKKEQIKIQRIGRAAIAAFFLNLFIFFFGCCRRYEDIFVSFLFAVEVLVGLWRPV